MTYIETIKRPLKVRVQEALQKPLALERAIQQRSFYDFFLYFWSEISNDDMVDNWHIKYLCNELQVIAERVGNKQPKLHDLIINIPPGTSKTSVIMKLFPVWCITRWYWMRFITASYSAVLSLESGEASRDVIRSSRFKELYPELGIKEDKDTKTNFKIIKENQNGQSLNGGNRYSTSVGGSVTGFHGHILIVDDPLNPNEFSSPKSLVTANHWCDQILSTRKVDKEVTPTIMVMQRLHLNDPSGHLLNKKKKNVKHICLPAEDIKELNNIKPKELRQYYSKGLLDPNRLNKAILNEMQTDLGQFGYAGQMNQNPVPPGGGMFHVDNFFIVNQMPLPHDIDTIIRFWDKAGSLNAGAYTAGVKIAKLKDGRYLVIDVVRGQWGATQREKMILRTAIADGNNTVIWIEQEPGSGGKESAESTIRNLAGFVCNKELPRGDKVYRADPYSVQVNNGNVSLLHGEWNAEFINEHRYFPLSTYKDQVDAAGAAFAKLNDKRKVNIW